MATASKQSRASRQLARPPAQVHAPIEFVIFEDNGGRYHWSILAGDGTTLGRSGDFASCDDAEQAAQEILDGAASARFARRGNRPVDLAARRAGRDDDSDPERWLDESGSFSSHAVVNAGRLPGVL
jgi:uncharacterized protein YegP (UPF0339 family)